MSEPESESFEDRRKREDAETREMVGGVFELLGVALASSVREALEPTTLNVSPGSEEAARQHVADRKAGLRRAWRAVSDAVCDVMERKDD